MEKHSDLQACTCGLRKQAERAQYLRPVYLRIFLGGEFQAELRRRLNIKTENFPWQKGKKKVLIVSSFEVLKGTVTQAVRRLDCPRHSRRHPSFTGEKVTMKVKGHRRGSEGRREVKDLPISTYVTKVSE